MDITVGGKLRAWGLSWTVTAIEPCGAQTRLRLCCAEGDLAGLAWELLHPWETAEPLDDAFRPETPGTVEAWQLLHLAWLREREPGPAVLTLDHPGRLTVEPYQLVPVLRALSLSRPRLLLADDVGLGKTVQAGMIAAELMLRRRAHRVIVVTPSGLLLAQWWQELRLRFGLRPVVLASSADIAAARSSRPLGGNPFEAQAFCLTSMDFAKQDAVLAELDRTEWDLAIIDEAHHCVASTRRRILADLLARRSEGLLLLSATPHDGDDAHFASLMRLLDPTLTDASGRLIGHAYRRHVVRRLKAHIRDPRTGRPRFPGRIVTPVPVALMAGRDDAFLAFHRALGTLITSRAGHAAGAADLLAFVSLMKRSVSTLHAVQETLRAVADRLAAPTPDDAGVWRGERARRLRRHRRRLERDGALTAEDAAELSRLEAEAMAAALRDRGDPGTARALRALIAMAERLAPSDPRLLALEREIIAIRSTDSAANVLVYTEYADSQAAAVAHLSASAAIGGTVLAICGADSEEVRIAAAERFAHQPCLVLVSTDALAEGLNLHRRCRHLIHLDLPYNPNRLEQRNGRIDRYGQREQPEIRYLYLADTFEERILLRLITRHERARAALGSMPETLGVTADPDPGTDDGLLRGFAQRQAALFPPGTSPIRSLGRLDDGGADATTRALLREIDHAYAATERMAAAHGWLTGAGVTSATCIPADRLERLTGVTPVAFLLRVAALAAGTTAEHDDTVDGRLLVPPAAWHAALDGLAGHDPAAGGIRLTADPERVMDNAGRLLACPGWAHPLVQRAAAWLRAAASGPADQRVCVAHASGAMAPAALLTYLGEAPCPGGWRLRDVVAIRVAPDSPPQLIGEPAEWLALAAQPVAEPAGRWGPHFAAWLPACGAAAERAARAVIVRRMRRAYRRAAAVRERERASLLAWLHEKAEALCGPAEAPMPDLFGRPPDLPDWRTTADPVERLGLLAGGSGDPDQRQQAQEALATYHDRTHRLTAGSDTTALTLRPLGMLLLVPWVA